jgi:hypothetical protein
MTFDNNNREKKLREFYEATGSKGALWIDDATGKIVDRSSGAVPVSEIKPRAASTGYPPLPSFVLSGEEDHSMRACRPRADIAIKIDVEIRVEF